ncbi:RNA polymerase sigma factor SigJ [Paenibacillus assamensis]|uniref:RNA polymerase sigma factor SigJ n=1 Tax=Paenibacillus assamensis TaxID=311244 RepID=UPI0004023A39|nr:RNA polymerase sigma factor SigJ [Paenibacillus assamensis]
MIELYEQYRGLMFRLAYQLTGSAADAEDAVQDVFVKVQSVDPSRFKEPKAYLCKMITNRCLDLLRSARKRREQYVGPWLPEPIPTMDDDSFEAVVRNDLLSYAILALLERLSAAERAVFVLREAMGFDYPTIAGLIDKSELNCRKLMSRARGKMGVSEEELIGKGCIGEEWVQQFLAALSLGKVDKVLSMLAEDAVLLSDGGGKVTAAVNPIMTSDRVARFLLGIRRNWPQEAEGEGGFAVDLAPISGQTGVVIRSNGVVQSVFFLDIRQGKVQHIYIVRNPDKLTRIS